MEILSQYSIRSGKKHGYDLKLRRGDMGMQVVLWADTKEELDEKLKKLLNSEKSSEEGQQS